MQLYIRSITSLSKALGVVAMLLLVAAIVVVTQMVFVRYVMNGSTIWQTEFVTYSIIASTFLGCPYVLLLKGHVNVDLFSNAAGPRLKFFLELTSRLCSIAFCAIVAWSGWMYFYEAWEKNWTTETVWALPLWIPLLPLPLGVGVLALQYLADIATLKQQLAEQQQAKQQAEALV